MQTFGGKDLAIPIAAYERASFCLVSRREGGWLCLNHVNPLKLPKPELLD